MSAPLTARESQQLAVIVQRVNEVRRFLARSSPTGGDVSAWFRYLAELKSIRGNADNDLSFLACILAKRHLLLIHGELSLDMAVKPQGARGLDVDCRDRDGRRIVGEIKTTTPYKLNDFGAQQWKSMRSDRRKLREAVATFKYFFVTDERAAEILSCRCAADLAGIDLVRLRVPS